MHKISLDQQLRNTFRNIVFISWVIVVKRGVQRLQVGPLAPTFGQVGDFDQFNIIWGANVVM